MTAEKKNDAPPEELDSSPRRGFRLWDERWDGWIVLAAALVVRAIYLFEIRHNDPFYAFTLEGFDQRTYQNQANDVLGGDILLREWGLFYYTPVYGYFCALLYSIGGSANFDLLHAVQGLLGAVTCWLLWALGRTWLTRGQAMLAAALTIFCRPWLFYEQLLLVEGLVVFLTLLVVYLLRTTELGHRFSLARVFVAGVLSTLAYIARGNFLVLIVIFPLWLLLSLASSGEKKFWNWRRGVLHASLYGAGVGFLLTPLLLRNHAVADEWRLGTTNGPALFYLGNAGDATGDFTYSPRFLEAKQRADSDPDAYWKFFREDIRKEPFLIVRNLWRKTRSFFNAFDIPDNTSIYLGRAFSGMLRWNPLNAHLLLLLGLVGAGLSLRRWRSESLLWVFLLFFAASIILIVPIGRYRIPVFLALLIFTARALGWVADSLLRRRWAKLGFFAAAVVVLGILTRPLPTNREAFNENSLVRPQDYLIFVRQALEQGKLVPAGRMIGWGMSEYPTFTRLQKLRLWYHVEIEDWEAAARDSQFMADDPSMSPAVGVALARLYLHEGLLVQAGRVLRAVLDSDPDYGPAIKVAAQIGDAMPSSD